MKEGKRNSDNKNNNSHRDHIDSNMDRLILRFNIAFQNANKYFQAVISFISNNMLWSASLFLFVFSALIFYFLFNNLTDGRPAFYTNIAYIGLFISMFYFLNIVLNPKREGETVYRGRKIFAQTYRYFLLISAPFLAFLLIYTIMNISKSILGITLQKSLGFSIIVLISFLALVYQLFLRKDTPLSKSDNHVFVFLRDLVFFIPCILIDVVEYLYNDYNNTTKTTFTLGGILIASIGAWLSFPTIQSLFKDPNEFVLKEECSKMDKTAYYISHEDLKKLIDNKDSIVKTSVKNFRDVLNGMKENVNKYKNSYDISMSEYNESEHCMKVLCDPSCCNIDENKGKCCDWDENEEEDSKEGFGEMHGLDISIQSDTLLSSFTPKEKHIIEKIFVEKEEKFRKLMNEYNKYPDKTICLIENYIKQNENYASIMNSIYTTNYKSADFIDQRMSSLVDLINSTYDIKDTNYHYGISFWVYFDPSIVQNDNNLERGIIMSYGRKPELYYNYKTRELILECASLDDSIIPEILYKSDTILYQRWNHFVINYNYGTLDLFINNNLVGSYKNISPFIDVSTHNLSFGDSTNTLDGCGVCDIRYFNIPITLSKVESLYVSGKK